MISAIYHAMHAWRIWRKVTKESVLHLNQVVVTLIYHLRAHPLFTQSSKRKETFRKHYEISQGEEIESVDFTCIYFFRRSPGPTLIFNKSQPTTELQDAYPIVGVEGNFAHGFARLNYIILNLLIPTFVF